MADDTFQPYYTDWSESSVHRIQDEIEKTGSTISEPDLAWECKKCGALNRMKRHEDCAYCGHPRTGSHIRAIWGM